MMFSKTKVLFRASIFLLFVMIFLGAQNLYAFEYSILGQLSGWSSESRDDDKRNNNNGLRYIPRIILTQQLSDEYFVDTELSLNGFVSAETEHDKSDSELKLYRLKLRFATAQTETRIGLQKINFGPAQLLRPLRMFDSVDPRDPLQLTGGVYGLRFKYNALNNSNIWLWCLYGNDDLKGYEMLETSSGKPEFGGRIQYPALKGEIAATFHTRNADASLLNGKDFTENRFALDGRWDMAVGFWFESVLQQQKTALTPYEWTKTTTLGTDYTFGVGNGLYVLGEHMAAITSNKPIGNENDMQFSALNLNYPIGYFDNLMTIAYYSWEDEKYYHYVGWQRIYDNLMFNFSVFKYPDSDNVSQGMPGQTNTMSGFGGQIMIIFNH
ncbi:hypothetical protein ACFL6K_04080 [Candidatus Latescibacterota bacterium]